MAKKSDDATATAALHAMLDRLARVGLDLSAMRTVDINELVGQLRDCAIVFAQFPARDRVILKGEALLANIIRTGRAETVSVACIKVANDEQRHVLVAALLLIEQGQMTPQAIATFAAMLRDVQSGSSA